MYCLLPLMTNWLVWNWLVLLGAGVISAGSQNRIPVTVLNNNEHPVQLYAGTRVGEISPITVQESDCNVNNVAHPPYQPHVYVHHPKENLQQLTLMNVTSVTQRNTN